MGCGLTEAEESRTMASGKVTLSVEIESEHNEWRGEVAKEFRFPDGSKSLRVLLDYAIKDGDRELIFSRRNGRCRFCG